MFPIAVCELGVTGKINQDMALLALYRGAPVDHGETQEFREKGPGSSFQKSQFLLAYHATRGTSILPYTMSGRSKLDC